MRSVLLNPLHKTNTTTKESHANDAAIADSPVRQPSSPSRLSPTPPATSSPPRNYNSSHQVTLPGLKHSSTTSRKFRISEDEKRLTANYNTIPEDSVPLPSPRDWVDQQKRSPATKMVKPGSQFSYSPINTIQGPDRRRTYAHKQKSQSQRRNGGFQNAPESVQEKEHYTMNKTHLQSDGSSSTKRRRTGPAPQEVISIDDDDDDDDIVDSSPVQKPLDNTTGPICNANSSTSLRSQRTTSHTVAQIPMSEFQKVDCQLDPHRKRARRSPAIIDNQTRTSPKENPKPNGLLRKARNKYPSSTAIHSPRDPKANRKIILGDFKQGEQPEVVGEGQHLPSEPKTTSNSWPKAQINESTEAVKPGSRKIQRRIYLDSGFGAGSAQSSEDSGSEDELQADMPKAKSSAIRIGASPSIRKSIPIPAPKGDNHASSHNLPKGKGWLLNYARTHDFEMRGPDLWMRKGDDKDSFRIVGLNRPTNEFAETTLFMNKVISAESDLISRIRIKGSQSQAGNQITHDLDFVDKEAFNTFRVYHVQPATMSQRVFSKEASHMDKLFAKALDKNEKVGTLPLVHRTESSSMNNQVTGHASGSKSTNWITKMLKPIIETNKKSAANEGSLEITERRVSTRPTRATRTTGLTYTETQESEPIECEKFSMVHGLGKPWDKPLQYSSGRRRAVVEFTDLPRLDEGEFLNDNLVNFYMIYLFDQMKVPANKVYFFNTHFYTRLTQKTGRKSPINYEAVKRWTLKDDIFSHDYIVVPINEASHWYLAIICNVSNIARKPVVEEFDDTPQADPRHPSNIVEETLIEARDEEEAIKVPELSTTGPPTSSLSDVQSTTIESNNESNLFEESNIDLVKPDAVESEKNIQSETEGRSTPTDTTGIAQLSIDDGSIPKSILSGATGCAQARKKTKRKSGPMFKKRNPDEPVVIILDSLGESRLSAVKALKTYIVEEGRDKRGMDANITEHGFYAKDGQIPLQENWCDCGVYLLGYAQKFFEDPDDFKVRILTGEMKTEADWPGMAMPSMRSLMRDILFGLNTARREERKLARKEGNKKPAAVTPTPELPSTVATKDEFVKSDLPQKTPQKSLSVQTIEPPKQQAISLPAEQPTKSSVEQPIGTPAEASHEPLQQKLGSPFSPRPSTAKDESPKEGTEMKTRASSSSPNKRRIDVVDTDTVSTLPISRKRLMTTSPLVDRNRIEGNSPKMSEKGAGSSDHPISIEDSQDATSIEILSPKQTRSKQQHRRMRSSETSRYFPRETPIEIFDEATAKDGSVVPETPETRRSSPLVVIEQ